MKNNAIESSSAMEKCLYLKCMKRKRWMRKAQQCMPCSCRAVRCSLYSAANLIMACENTRNVRVPVCVCRQFFEIICLSLAFIFRAMFRFPRETQKREMSKLHYHDYAFVGLKMKIREKLGQVSIHWMYHGSRKKNAEIGIS